MKITIGNRYFVLQGKLVDTLFNPGGTASGEYRPIRGGVQFFLPNGNLFAFLVIRPAEAWFVSASKVNGQTWYSYGLCVSDAEKLGLGRMGYAAQRDIAENLAPNFR